MKIEKPEKIVGCVILIVGLILARAFCIFSNVCLIFFISIVIIWVLSIISDRGLTLIKGLKLKIVGGSLGK